MAQLEGGHDGIGAGEGDVGRTGQGLVGVEPRPRPLQRVIVLFGDTIIARARDRVRFLDGVVAGQKHLDDLVVVVVPGQDERRDVGRELRLLLCPKEGVATSSCPFQLVLARHVVWVLDDDLDDLGGALADGVQQGLLDVLEAELVEQQLDALHALRVDGQVQGIAPHVVDAVEVEHDLALLQGLSDDGHVPESRRVDE